MRCPVCDQSALEPFFQGGEVPLFVNVLHRSAADARAAARGPMELGGCATCGFVHNLGFDESRVAYAPGYENSLHGSPVFQAWARSLAAGLVERHGLRGRRAVEIGGGRAEFMELLLEAGCAAGLVMDPSAPDDALGSHRGDAGARLTIERRLFQPADAQGDPATGLLLSRHVLEHLADPAAFVDTVADAARGADAGVYLEVPNGLWTLRDLGIWDLIYEHCSYFTPRALATLLGRAGLGTDVQETYGGQFLAAEGRPSAGAAPPTGTDDTAPLRRAFAAAHRSAVDHWDAQLERWQRAGTRAAVWGAGSKGATFLNTLAASEAIVCAVDVNERKWGLHVAGTGHRIVGPGELAGLGVDALVVMNPRYVDEIRTMAHAAGCEAEVLPIAA